MQITEYNDGKILKDLFPPAKFEDQLKSMRAKYEETIKQKEVKSVKQVKNIGRNDDCPCQGGLKFGDCCLSKYRDGLLNS